MTPEEFYKRDRLIKYTHQTVKEMVYVLLIGCWVVLERVLFEEEQ